MVRSWDFICLRLYWLFFPQLVFFYIFQPGDPRLASKLTADVSAIASSDVSISIKDTIVNIIPSNFVKPFLESNMLQLIFLAILIGIALGKIRRLFKDIEGYI